MGPQEDYIETVVTCEGDFHDPQLQDRLRRFQQRLENLLLEDGKKQLILKKVEPWNSVRITFSIPRQAALRLKQMAQQGSATLRQIGVLGVQIQGDRLVSLTVATSNNQRAELIISTHEGSGQGSAVGSQQTVSVGTSFDPGMPSSSEEQGSPGPNMEVTRKNIEEYLRQGSLFNSIPAPACVPGPSRAGPSHDIMKTPSSADGTAFRINNIAVDGLPGPSSLPGIPERPAFLSSDSHGPAPMAMQQSMSVPVSGQCGPRMSVAQHGMLRPQRYSLSQPKQQHQQLSQLPAEASALPQTAALGYNILGLPPPPPYPHGHGMTVANNVIRQGKKPPASSPLLINLLQTEPVAGSNNVMAAPGTEKKVKKHRRRKEKQASVTGTLDGQAAAQGLTNLPPESDTFSGGVPPQTMPSQEEMSAVLHRQVSPIPLPSPRLGTGFSNSVPVPGEVGNGSEGFRDKNPTASAALASLAQNQKSTSESEQVSDNSIINPYTGHMEPRDSASDLSPVKQDQQKPRKSSFTEGSRNETSVSGVSLSTQVSLAAAKEDLKLSSSDSLCLRLGSFQPGAAVPNTLREERPKGFSSSVISSEHSLVSDCVFGQRPDSGLTRVATESSTLPNSAASHIYAQHPFGPSQPLPRAPHVAPQHSTHAHTPKTGTSTVNGPIQVTMPPSSFPVSGQLSTTEKQLQMSRLVLEGGLADPYGLTSHKPRSVHGDIVHNVSVGREAKMDDTGGQLCGDTNSRQPVAASSSQPLTHKAIPALEMRTSISTVAVQAQSDSLKLLNSSSVSLGVAQRLAVDSAIPTASTASPAAIKTPSDGEDNNSNHSGISPVSTVAPAPSSLLDANGTKVENHDSGMGSSSERSDDTTPSEVGDGDFQTNVPTTESPATDNSCKKSAAAVKKTMVNCKKESAGSSDAHTITVGYVQMNQFNTDPYNKESKKNIAEAPLLIGDKSIMMDETLREVSNLIKSSASLTPAASPVTSVSHKDASVSLPLPTKISGLQYQQVMMKQKAAMNYQVSSDMHQNGPTSVPSGVQAQHLQGQHIPSSMQAGVHHPTSITVSHHQNQLGVSRFPVSTVSSSASQEQIDRVSNSQSYSVRPHQTSSIANSLGQGGQRPLSVHNQIVRTGLHPASISSGQPPGLSPHVPACVPGEAVTASLLSSTARNSQATVGPLLQNASQMTGNIAGLSKNKGQTTVTRDLTNPVTQEHQVTGKPPSSLTQRIVSQGHTSLSSNRTSALHPVNVTSGLGQHAATTGSVGLSAYSSSISLASHPQGTCFQGPTSQVPISQSPSSLAPSSPSRTTLSPSLHSAGSKLAKTQSSLPPASTAVPKNTTTHAFTPAGHQHASSMSNHPVSSSHNMVTSNLLHPVSCEMESKGHVLATAISSAQISDGDLVKHPLPNTGAANSTVSITTGLDLGSVASDLVSDASLAELALLEESSPHGDDVFSAEDLALISEPGLSAYLDVGVRHGTTNGNASVSTETRAGVNITSMYTKRSSPINVNMLNHIYAAGLPQPRRLTESVQRLVKPLPNPENSLLPGRACKSPSASSRHSSNGSGSPGRANQGGARSPGASLSVTSPARNLVFDKLIPSLSAAAHSSSVNAGSNSLAPHLAHPAFGANLNCINTSVIPAAPHPLATLQSSASSRHKAGNSSVSVSLSSTCVASSVTVSSSSVTSTFSSALSSSLTLTPSPVSNSILSHTHGNSTAVLKDSLSSRLQLDHLSHSVSSHISKHSIPLTATLHHPHQPSSVGVAQPDLRPPDPAAVSSSAVSSLPTSPAVCNRVTVRLPHQAVPPVPEASSVSVCNTSFVDSVTGKTNIHLSSCIQPVLTSSSSVQHFSPASSSSPVVSSCPSSGVLQLQQMPAACSSFTRCQNSTVTSVSSSTDLGSHTTVVTAGHVHPAIAATSSVCSNTLAASKSADFPVTHTLSSMSHSVTAGTQQALTVSGSVPQGKTSINSENSTRISVEMKPEFTGQVSDSVHKRCTDPSSSTNRLTEVTSCSVVKTVLLPPPVISSQRESGVIASMSDMLGPQSLRPSSLANISAGEKPSQINTTAVEKCAPETLTVAKSLSQSAKLKEIEKGEKLGGSGSASVSQHSLQDSISNSHSGQSENPHSKPPLLHPAPPLTLPALIPSATPPPPPLTPVLLQETGRKEATSSPNQVPSVSDVARDVEASASSNAQERISTASPFFLASDPAAGTEKKDVQENVVSSHITKDSKRDEEVPKDDTSTYSVPNEAGEPDGLSSEQPSACLSIDENSLKTRRLTRKRKSTNSESDSSSEPAPKISCLEGSAAGENTGVGTSKTCSSDIPPRLHKEGKKSHVAEKGDDDRGGKKVDDRLAKREEDEKGEKEEKSGVKNAPHHDRNILDATPEEVAKKMAAAGSKRRVHYTYVLEKVTPGQSYFDTPVLTGRTRSQGTKGSKESSSASTGTTSTLSASSSGQTPGGQLGGAGKEESGEIGSKRSTRLRTKDTGESTQSKRKRAKEQR